LQQLAKQLPEVLTAARAPATNTLYTAAFKRWRVWTDNFVSIVALPASPQGIMLYFLHLSKQAHSFSVINLAASALAWAHALAGFTSPTKDVLVVECLAGLQRKLAKPKCPKEPFLLSHIHSFMCSMNANDLGDVRDTCLLVLGFYGFLRFDEVVHLTGVCVQFHVDHVALNIVSAKTDQLREGNVVIIAKLDAFCPVGLLHKYMCMSMGLERPSYFLFRRVVKIKNRSLLQSRNVPLSYNVVRSLVKKKACSIGLKSESYGTHSMRAGGSSAAANAGVNDRAFQRHGRWASVSAKNGYIKDSLSQKMAVTLAIK
jgi:hypothetical protein